MRTNFDKLTKEIDLFLDLLKYFENKLIGYDEKCSILSVEIVDKDEYEAVFKSLKSNVILMLYNLVESTIRLTMNNYYDRFNNRNISYKHLVEDIKKTWIRQSLGAKQKNDSIQKNIYSMIEIAISENAPIHIDFESFSLSGNADLREIKDILKTHGINYKEDEFKTFGGSLKSIKDMRNSLAHGNISFQDNGRILSVSELYDYKEQAYLCLDYFMKIVEENMYKLPN